MASHPMNQEAVVSEKPVHFLLIEDEEAHTELIKRAFQTQTTPVQLTSVHSLREAWEHLHASPPDLVITDIRLPDGSGTELLSQETDSPFPVIVMTSYGDEEIAVEAMKSGVLDYVVKSEATLIDMPHIAERALRQWHEIQERRRAEKELRTRAKQLASLSHLSHQVLSGIGIDTLMKEVVNLIAHTLNVRFIMVLELLPDQKNLLLRAATGWQEPSVGQMIPMTAQDPLTSHILTSGEAVFIEDLHTDERLQGSLLPRDPGQASGMSLPLCGQDRCLGILWACSDQRWALTNNDITFLQSTGNTLAVAMERSETEARIRKLQNDLVQASQFSTLGELGSTLAHEVNQPITAIINYVRACQQIILSEQGHVTQTIHELMDKAVAEAERAASIIHHIREFIRSGELHQTPEPLNAIIYDASQLALGEAADNDIKLHFDFDSQLPPAYVDKIQIQQVVFNLVRNAVEALKGAEKKIITIKTSLLHNPAIEVQIQDNGPGVDPLLTKKIFQQRFSTKREGMGIGLSISYSIIQAHSGDLWVSETPGGGATFHFTVPLLAETAPTH